MDNSKSVHKLAKSLRSLSHLSSRSRQSHMSSSCLRARAGGALQSLRPHSFGDPSANIQGPSVVEETSRLFRVEIKSFLLTLKLLMSNKYGTCQPVKCCTPGLSFETLTCAVCSTYSILRFAQHVHRCVVFKLDYFSCSVVW